MLFIIQNVIYLACFTASIVIVVRKGPIGGIFFYPKPVQERVFELGLADRQKTGKRTAIYMTLLMIGVIVLPAVFIGVWNHVTDFKSAYIQALIMLEIMNWYDGIFIDRLWVGHSKFWIIPEAKDLPYVKSWEEIFRKRIAASVIYLAVAALVAWLAGKM